MVKPTRKDFDTLLGILEQGKASIYCKGVTLAYEGSQWVVEDTRHVYYRGDSLSEALQALEQPKDK